MPHSKEQLMPGPSATQTVGIEDMAADPKITIFPGSTPDSGPGLVETLHAEIQALKIENQSLKEEIIRKDTFFADSLHSLKNAFAGPLLFLRQANSPGRKLPISQKSLTRMSLEAMEAAHQRLVGFPEQLEIVGKIRRQPVEMVSFLAGVASHFLEPFQQLEEYQGLRLSFQSETESETIMADRQVLEDIFQNLIVNAVQAMKDSPNQCLGITIKLTPKGINIHIEDTGCGIAPEDKSKIFAKKFTTKENGNGLGLFDVSNKVLAHGGKVSLEKTSENGSSFVVFLPIREAQPL